MILLLSTLLVACKSAPSSAPETDTDTDTDSDTDTDTDTDTDSDTDSDTDTDVTPPVVGTGSVAVVAVRGLPTTAKAIFFEGQTDLLNAAECAGSALCRESVPLVDEELEAPLLFDPNGVNELPPGAPVEVGGVELLTFPGSPMLENLVSASGPLSMSWEADFGWTAADLPDLIEAVEPLHVTSPSTDVDLVAGEVVPFRWTAESGSIELEIRATDPGGKRWAQVRGLADTGSYDLPVDDLELLPANVRVDMVLSRVAYGESVVGGQTVRWSRRDAVEFKGWSTDSSRDELLPTACDDPPIGPGRYRGQLSAGTSVLDPGQDGCVGFPTPGSEIVAAVDIPAGQRLHARYRILDGWGKIYGLSDCQDVSTCLGGADTTSSSDGGAVDWLYLNDGTEVERVYVVLDGDGQGDRFHLDLALETVVLDDLSDTCAEAELATPLTSDTVVNGTLVGFSADLDPVFGGCGFSSYDGEDALIPVTLQPGERMIARPTGPIGLHAATDCTDAMSCTGSSFPGEPLFSSNATSAAITTYVAADQYDVYAPAQSFQVEFEVFTPAPLQPEDSCSTLASAPLLTTGVHHFSGDLGGFADDLDLAAPGPSCTGSISSGHDGIVRVELQAGETVAVDYVLPGSDGSVYLLEDCADTSTAVACDDNSSIFPGQDSPEAFSYRNDGSTAQTYTLVLDRFQGSSLVSPFLLDVRIN